MTCGGHRASIPERCVWTELAREGAQSGQVLNQWLDPEQQDRMRQTFRAFTTPRRLFGRVPNEYVRGQCRVLQRDRLQALGVEGSRGT